LVPISQKKKYKKKENSGESDFRTLNPPPPLSNSPEKLPI